MIKILKKDLQLIFRTKTWVVPFLYSFFGIYFFFAKKQSFSASFFLILVFYILVNSIFSYDYKYNGEKFIFSFPVKRSDEVKGKYMLLVLSIIMFSIIFSLVFIIMKIFGVTIFLDTPIEVFNFRVALTFITLGIFFAIVMPIHYKFGYGKVRWLNFIILLVTSVLTGIISDIFSTSIHLWSGGINIILSIIFFIVVLYISMNISIKFCEKRDI